MSTYEQNITMQLDCLNQYGCDEIFTDKGISGIKKHRPGLSQALEFLSDGDTFIVWKLDRLGRSLLYLCDVMKSFEARNINFVSITDQIDTGSSSGKLVFHMMAALAEFERDLIIERTKAGMASAKAHGVKMGRPSKLTKSHVKQIRQLIKTTSKREIAKLYNVHVNTISNALKD